MANHTRRLRWFQYSLRTLLLVMLMASVGMSWFAVKMQWVRRQREAVEVITRLGGFVTYDWRSDGSGLEPPGPAWLRNLLGEDFFGEVVEVLLAHHADVNVKTTNGVSALALAELKGHNDIVKLLLPTVLTVDGVIYSNVTFGTLTLTTVQITYKTGVTGIPLEKLAPDLQKALGYDPEKAAAYRAASAPLQQQATRVPFPATRNTLIPDDGIRWNDDPISGKASCFVTHPAGWKIVTETWGSTYVSVSVPTDNDCPSPGHISLLVKILGADGLELTENWIQGNFGQRSSGSITGLVPISDSLARQVASCRVGSVLVHRPLGQ